VLVRGSPHAGEVHAPRPPRRAKARDRPTLARSIARPGPPPDPPSFASRPARAPGSVDALIAQGPGDPSPAQTVTSIADQPATDLVIRVAIPRRAAPGPPDLPGAGDLIRTAGTVGASRNTLLARSDAEYVLVLEPIDTLLPGALARLVDALAEHPEAAAAYPLTADADGEIGNALPLEAGRLARHAYLGAPALWRRDALVELGGWYPGAELEPLEDHDLWRRLAADGDAHLVAQILVRRRFRAVSLLGPADVDSARAERLIDARCTAATT
jgi:hypothetical protein